MRRDTELTVYDDRYLGNEATPVSATVRYDILDDRAILERGMLSQPCSQLVTHVSPNQYYAVSCFIELTEPTRQPRVLRPVRSSALSCLSSCASHRTQQSV